MSGINIQTQGFMFYSINIEDDSWKIEKGFFLHSVIIAENGHNCLTV